MVTDLGAGSNPEPLFLWALVFYEANGARATSCGGLALAEYMVGEIGLAWGC